MQDKGRQVNVLTELHERMNKRRWCAQAGLSKQNSKQGQVSGKKIQIQAICPGTRKLTEDTQTDKEGGG